MLPVHHPRLELEARLLALLRHAVEIAVGDELEAHRDQAVVDLPLALELHLVDVLLGQGVLHLPEAIVVQLRGVDVAADQFRGERLPQRERAGDGAVGVVRVIDRNVNALVHCSLQVAAKLTPSSPMVVLPRASARAVTPPHPANHGEFDRENQQRRRHHRADGRWDDFRLDVERVPGRETSPVAPLARQPVPDGEGDGHELSGRDRGARGCATRPLEDDRPFPLVVARHTRHVAGVVRRDVRAAFAGELQRSGGRQIEEPEIDGILTVAKDEVGLPRTRRRLRRNLDRDGIGELRYRRGRRRWLGKRIGGLRGGSGGRRGRGRRRPPPPRAAPEATARSCRLYRRSCRASERAARPTRRRRWPERSRTSREDGTSVRAP